MPPPRLPHHQTQKKHPLTSLLTQSPKLKSCLRCNTGEEDQHSLAACSDWFVCKVYSHTGLFVKCTVTLRPKPTLLWAQRVLCMLSSQPPPASHCNKPSGHAARWHCADWQNAHQNVDLNNPLQLTSLITSKCALSVSKIYHIFCSLDLLQQFLSLSFSSAGSQLNHVGTLWAFHAEHHLWQSDFQLGFLYSLKNSTLFTPSSISDLITIHHFKTSFTLI